MAVAWAAPHGSRGETEADWGVRTAGLFPAGGGGGTPRESESKQSLSKDVLGAPLSALPFGLRAGRARVKTSLLLLLLEITLALARFVFFFSPPTLRERITQERRGQEGELAFVARTAGGVGSIWGI